ncbi:SGNH/GDSL hydrolase family protein [Paracoccus caeni]|uniref:SGNH/GDSL hydrolase family protein n=1 Tax=Paracoccus caeni TaxID=657651 RepID=A0A934SFX2_9RHOB|nr:SGNH/GDSL hydrolase family protein [Paracoccus caeni]
MALFTLIFLASCGLVPKKQGGDILVIGDSVMAWNGFAGADIGDVIAAELDRDVVNRAALGARFQAGGAATLIGLNIPAQLSSGRWTWVVMNGGANDLGGSCGCTRCDGVVDALISADGKVGQIPNLIARAQSQGAQVLWMGYYQAPKSTSFKGCRPALVELERRIALHAGLRAGFYFLDAEDAFDPTDDTLFASDLTHPSQKGSAVLGRFLAKKMSESAL